MLRWFGLRRLFPRKRAETKAQPQPTKLLWPNAPAYSGPICCLRQSVLQTCCREVSSRLVFRGFRCIGRSGFGAAALFSACAIEAANATVEIETEFSFEGEAITPDNADIAKATSIAFGAMIVEAVETDNTGLVPGAFLTVANPIPVGLGEMFTLSWTTAKGAFSVTLTEKALSPVPNTSQAIVTTGAVTGPPGFSSSPVNAGFVFNQDGSNFQLLGGVHVPASDPAVPELSTWAMMTVGFGGFGALAFRRSRSAANLFS